MSVGMVPLPVLPVKAPSPNCCPSPSKPFACHSYGKSIESSTSSDAATTRLDIVLGRANPFALISFTDPQRLNSVVSYRYKDIRGRASSKTTAIHFDSLLGCANSFALNLFADPHPLNPVVSILYKIIGGRVVASPFQSFKPFQPSEFAEQFLATEACRPKNRLCYTGT